MKRLAPPALALLSLFTVGVVVHAMAPSPPPATARAPVAPLDGPPARAAGSPEARGPSPGAVTGSVAPGASRDLDLRVDGLTLAEALAGVGRYARGDRPDHSRWLFRVSGFLARYPEHSAAFAEAALGEQATADMQALAADVLAGVGHGPARVALRGLIDRSALGPAVRHRLMQSHLTLRTPDAETADWLARQLDDAEVGPAAVNALGAVAGRLAAVDPGAAAAAADRLEAGLDRATSALARRAHLLALGNSGLPQARAALAHVDSDDVDVRAAAARALRRLDDAGSREALHRLAGDTDPRVQARAVEALGARLTAADAEHLAGAARAGSLAPAAEGALLAVALAFEGAGRLELLDALALGAATPRVRERARVALLTAR